MRTNVELCLHVTGKLSLQKNEEGKKKEKSALFKKKYDILIWSFKNKAFLGSANTRLQDSSCGIYSNTNDYMSTEWWMQSNKQILATIFIKQPSV